MPRLADSLMARSPLVEKALIDSTTSSALASALAFTLPPSDHTDGHETHNQKVDELQYLLRRVLVAHQEHLERSLLDVQSFVLRNDLSNACVDQVASHDIFVQRDETVDIVGRGECVSLKVFPERTSEPPSSPSSPPSAFAYTKTKTSHTGSGTDHLELVATPCNSPSILGHSKTKKSTATDSACLSQKLESGNSSAKLHTMSQISRIKTALHEKNDARKRSQISESYGRLTKRNGSFLLSLFGLDDANLDKISQRISKKHRALDCFRDVVFSNAFSVVLVTAILLNAAFIAFTTDHELSNSVVVFRHQESNLLVASVETPAWFCLVNSLFFGIFTVELFLRIVALEMEFCIGPEWKWNYLDVFLWLTSLTDIVLTSTGFQMNFIKLFRLMKMMRSIRLIRVLRFFRQLRLMLLSLMNSVMPLLWAVILLALIVFTFAVIAMQGVTDYIAKAFVGDTDAENMLELFNGLPMTFLAHLGVVTGGMGWWEMSRLLQQCSSFYLATFVFYILVMVLMVLNIVTGIFVTDAIQMAQSDREFSMQAKLENDNLKFKELRRLFSELDTEDSGKISVEDFEELIKIPRVGAAFSSLGLEVSDAASFFKMLDVDGSMELEIDEFVVGCMQMTGDAKAVSVNLLISENKRIMAKQAKQYAVLNARLKNVAELLNLKGA